MRGTGGGWHDCRDGRGLRRVCIKRHLLQGHLEWRGETWGGHWGIEGLKVDRRVRNDGDVFEKGNG